MTTKPPDRSLSGPPPEPLKPLSREEIEKLDEWEPSSITTSDKVESAVSRRAEVREPLVSAPAIQRTHEVTKAPQQKSVGFIERLVARTILPALSKPKPEGAEKPLTPTLSLEELTKDIAGARRTSLNIQSKRVQDVEPEMSPKKGKKAEQLLGIEQAPILEYPSHRFEFFPNVKEHVIVPIPPHTAVDATLADILRMYKAQGKNVILVETDKAEPGKPTDRDNPFSIISGIKTLFEESPEHKGFIECVETFPQVTRTLSTKAEDAARKELRGVSSLVRQVAVPSTDGANGVVLSGLEIRLDASGGIGALSGPVDPDPKKQKWIVYFNKNDATVEGEAEFLGRMARRCGANVISCDYRGVGRSSGFPTKEEDLIADGNAVVEYLKRQGVPEENILLHGASLGGAVATHVADMRSVAGEKNVQLCSDRSFSSLSLTIKKIGSILDKVFPKLAKLAKRFANYMAKSYGWKLDSGEKLKSLIQKGVNVTLIHHKDDQIVHIDAQAHAALLPDQLKKVELIELKETWGSALELRKKLSEKLREGIGPYFRHVFGYAHNRMMRLDEEDRFVKAVKKALKIDQLPFP